MLPAPAVAALRSPAASSLTSCLGKLLSASQSARWPDSIGHRTAAACSDRILLTIGLRRGPRIHDAEAAYIRDAAVMSAR